MNKIWKGLLLIVLVLTLSCNMLPLGAQNVEGEATPLMAVGVLAGVELSVSGKSMRANVYYIAGLNLTSADVYTYLQKYENGAWKAASSTATCAWNDKSSASHTDFNHYLTLTASGSYRAKSVFYFYGTGGDQDRAERYDYYTYNA